MRTTTKEDTMRNEETINKSVITALIKQIQGEIMRLKSRIDAEGVTPETILNLTGQWQAKNHAIRDLRQLTED